MPRWRIDVVVVVVVVVGRGVVVVVVIVVVGFVVGIEQDIKQNLDPGDWSMGVKVTELGKVSWMMDLGDISLGSRSTYQVRRWCTQYHSLGMLVSCKQKKQK